MTPAGALTVSACSRKQVTSGLGTSGITVKTHRADGVEFYASLSGALSGDEMRELLDSLLFMPERSIML